MKENEKVQSFYSTGWECRDASLEWQCLECGIASVPPGTKGKMLHLGSGLC